MDVFQARLNEILIDVFWNILKVQEDFVKRVCNEDISMSEMHLIEAVGDCNLQAAKRHGDCNCPGGTTISELAEALNITLPSVTNGIKRLTNKRCVEKVRCANDGRMVYVRLTPLGQEIYDRHHKFHQKMVESMAAELSEVEKNALIKGIEGLNAFFKQKIIQESQK